jgi:hypothetical protein
MSALLGGSSGVRLGFPDRNDMRLWPNDMQPFEPMGLVLGQWEDGFLWPRSRLIGDPGNPNVDALLTGKWTSSVNEGGTQTRLRFRGVVRDAAGNALSSGVVHLILTSGDVFVQQANADAAGGFEAMSQFASTNHYLVGYKAGSPDIAGTTVNTLQPT